MGQKTLSGMRIALTRDTAANAPLRALLETEGAAVYDCPLIRILPPVDGAPLRLCLHNIHTYDWVVLTSANAARAVAEVLRGVRVAVIGAAPQQITEVAGARVELVAERATGKGMLEALLASGVTGARILWPRSELAPLTLMQGLQAHGATVDAPVAYRNIPDDEGAAELKRLLLAGQLDAIAFASASAVHNAVAAVGQRLHYVRLYAIGPMTSQAIREVGLSIAGESADHSVHGLAQAIIAGESQRE
jgi:uroporphyrinogen-III synthase